MAKDHGRIPVGDRAAAASAVEPASRLQHSQHPLRKKSRHKPRDHFVKRRKHAVSLKRGAGGINDCWRPSHEATKADLAEYHAEEMKLRRKHQLARKPGFTAVDPKDRP